MLRWHEIIYFSLFCLFITESMDNILTGDSLAHEYPKDMTKSSISISDVDPLKDYQNHMENRLHYDSESGIILAEIWEEISYAVCDCIWKMLFDVAKPSNEHLDKARELLKKFRNDSKAINPYVYNGFIDKLRSECLNQNLREFWTSVVEVDDEDDETNEHWAPAVPPCGEVYYNYTYSRIVTPLNIKTSPKQEVVLTKPDFDKNLPLEKLLENYERIKQQLDRIHIADDKFNDVWEEFTKMIFDCVWSLIIDSKSPSPSQENTNKACGLLKRYRDDAVYINWSIYNEWIHKFRDSLLEHNMKEFLRNEIVAKQLGPCRSLAENFPFDDEYIEVDFSEFKADLSLKELLDLYRNAMDNKMNMDWEQFSDIYQQFSEAISNCIWQIMFGKDPPTPPEVSEMEKANVLLKTYREDSIMVNPSFYNEWIFKFRDELLKRELYDFWSDVMVKQELGPLWARDCDFFDDLEDPEPAEFYNHAGCQAIWLSETEEAKPQNVEKEEISTPRSLKPISITTPLEDYKHNMMAQGQLDRNDKLAYKKIFSEIRNVLWQLLFERGDATSLSKEKIDMASSLLQAYREDACYFAPYEYNEWIINVRDELIKRKWSDFWQIIVDKDMGLCSAKDSLFFHNKRDPKPKEFYQVGTELMAK
ncbi:uncharacterized protein [Musca autumnalis]|uniref:uncharacterized protein n=1 Tax=Musca autumnalis TaxID=221902 RepID=UPI003CE74919